MNASEERQMEGLTQRLSEAEATIQALLSGQIDAVVDATSQTPVLLARAQDALREERDRAQRYLDTPDVILLALDLDGRITLVNRYACAVLGRPVGELLGRSWIDTCLPASMRDAGRTAFRRLIEGDLSLVEAPILSKLGNERLIEWRNTVLRDDQGGAIGTFSSGADITERHSAAEALRITEERTRFALQSAGVGIWDMDFSTGVLSWSETLEAQYGLRPGTFAGTFDAFIAIVHPDDRAATLETMAEANRTGADFSVPHRTVWPDGTVRWLNGAGRIHLDECGQPVRGLGISVDVTERRTLDDQYRQAQKMEAVGRLASGVAHDFNNLLTVILGFTELMTADDGTAGRHGNDLGEIIKAAQRAAGLTKQLLAFSRQQVLHATPLDVNGLITEMTGMLERLIGEHVEVELILAPFLSAALVDRSQLEQVVMNLVVNARDAMPLGGRISIETADVTLENSGFHQTQVAPGAYVMLAVSDTGSGMTKETKGRLFEPFFTTKESGKGTGLGLSTTYGIVKQSQGYIWVYSELGRGTTFKVYLPRATGEIRAPALSRALTAPVKRASETVLLVEDEAGVRHLSKRILENAGYRVLEAANGNDAEKLFQREAGSCNLLVTDVMMPGCGGPELHRRLKDQAPTLRVLYMSGYTEQSAVDKGGIDPDLPFVQKPFTSAEFLQQVREALDS